MHIGILCESDYDSYPLSKIVENIAKNELNLRNLEFLPKETYGPIVGSMESAVELFFETYPPCQMAIFITDKDNYPEKQKKIQPFITKYLKNYPNNKILYTRPNPCFEEWLLQEENAIKYILPRVPQTSPLPFSEFSAKDRLLKIIHKYNRDLTKSDRDCYTEIAQFANLPLLCKKDTSFKFFYEQLVSTLKELVRA